MLTLLCLSAESDPHMACTGFNAGGGPHMANTGFNAESGPHTTLVPGMQATFSVEVVFV